MEQSIKPRLGVVIVAGGKGVRMGGGATPKQFRFLGQLPILAHSINLFADVDPSAQIVVVLPADHIEYWNNLSSRFNVAKHTTVAGGAQRFDSVKNGIDSLPMDCEVIAVHDGVRPMCSVELVDRAISCAMANGSAVPAIEVVDSFREIGTNGESEIIDRSKLRAIQTPQIFDAVTLRRAYKQPYDAIFTDDASVVERMGERVWLCQGDRSNIKITTSEDLIFANALLEAYAELSVE
ncbi:MAG: 2-C-methyl-D-erythritol 4-phosphate cytidylyltransferase [Rikenellaceae bacterium]